MNLLDLINIRPLESADLNFILDSSVKCLSKYNESMFKGWSTKDTCVHLEKCVLYFLSSPTYTTWIACHKDDDQQILSYIVADISTNHIALQFTKYAYRKLGIQKYMLLPLVVDPDRPVSVNYQTREMLKLQRQGQVRIYNKLVEELLGERNAN